MMIQKSFQKYSQLQELIQKLNLPLKCINNISPLLRSYKLGDFNIPNRIVFQPMEGCDADTNGIPSTLTNRRYHRFGQSGAGIVWFEATAVTPEGRANPHQLMLNEENKTKFQQILIEFQSGQEKMQKILSKPLKSLKILQLTHSGRYSKPEGKIPQRMYSFPKLDQGFGLKPEMGKILSDDYLDNLSDYYYETARLAKEIGFDGVDIKACHRYLLNESFSAFSREDSKYGGFSYKNRTRLFRNIIKRLTNSLQSPKFIITSRMNAYDGHPFPYGWGVEKKPMEITSVEQLYHCIPAPDLKEPIHLISDLHALGIPLVNISIGNPYLNPFISRPYSQGVPQGRNAPEHPLQGVFRFQELIAEIRAQVPQSMAIIGGGYSFLRNFGPYYAAHQIEQNQVDFVGWGRMSFAYPTFPAELYQYGQLSAKKSCIACSKCTELMRNQSVTGCVIRDAEVYRPIYQKATKKLES